MFLLLYLAALRVAELFCLFFAVSGIINKHERLERRRERWDERKSRQLLEVNDTTVVRDWERPGTELRRCHIPVELRTNVKHRYLVRERSLALQHTTTIVWSATKCRKHIILDCTRRNLSGSFYLCKLDVFRTDATQFAKLKKKVYVIRTRMIK